MIPDITISPLDLHPSDANTVAEWIASEWGRLPIHDYFETIGHHKQWTPSLPRTLIAHFEQRIIGTVSVLLNDLETHPEINPWLGCLYVVPDRRRHGIGVKLLLAAERMAAEVLGISTLYLFTEGQMALYARHGWTTIESDVYHSRPITIMTKRLC